MTGDDGGTAVWTDSTKVRINPFMQYGNDWRWESAPTLKRLSALTGQEQRNIPVAMVAVLCRIIRVRYASWGAGMAPGACCLLARNEFCGGMCFHHLSCASIIVTKDDIVTPYKLIQVHINIYTKS